MLALGSLELIGLPLNVVIKLKKYYNNLQLDKNIVYIQ